MTGTATPARPGTELRGVLRRAWPLARPHRWWLFWAAMVSVLATATELAVPVLAGLAVDAVVDGDRDRLRAVAVGFAALAVVGFGVQRCRLVLTAAATERVLLDLRSAVSGALLRRPLGFYDSTPAGDVIARATTDVTALSRFVRGGLRQLFDVLLLLAVTAVVLVATSWQLTLVALAVIPAAALSLRRFHRDSTRAYARYARGQSEVTATAAEIVACRETAQAAGAQPVLLGRGAAADAEMLAANDESLRAENRLSVLDFWQLAALAVVLAAAGVLAERGVVQVGAITTVALALRQLFDPLASLGWLYGSALEAQVRLGRILELLESPPPGADPAVHAGARRHSPMALELSEVGFAYRPGEPVLTGVSLRIEAGEHVAMVGPTGAGKSTLARLAAGLLAPSTGRVLLDGVDLADAEGGSVASAVVALPQDVHLLAGTVADNLRLVPGVHSDAKLLAAADALGLGDWLAALPAGLDTEVGPRGANLSAGERQLVALLRAALADPGVLILDEATADVDPATDALVSAALARLGSGRTLIVVAHRPATAARYPRVIQIAAGRVVHDTKLGCLTSRPTA